jgi:hypothetical protein
VLLREVALVLAGVLVYFGVRGWTHGIVDQATSNARLLLRLERSTGLYVEPWLQSPVRDSHIFTTVMNWVYIWGHWPVIVATLLWLVLRHPSGYRLTRNAMLISGAVGLVVFALFPVAPPRLADPGLIDTITAYSNSYRVLQPPGFVNQYAAMPSLHVGWDLLIGLAILAHARWLWLRVIGVLLPLLMSFAVLATANHYVVDVAAGVALVLVSRFAADRLASAAGPRRPSRTVTGPSRHAPPAPVTGTGTVPRQRDGRPGSRPEGDAAPGRDPHRCARREQPTSPATHVRACSPRSPGWQRRLCTPYSRGTATRQRRSPRACGRGRAIP